MRRHPRLVALLVGVLLLAACGGDTVTSVEPSGVAPAPLVAASPDPAPTTAARPTAAPPTATPSPSPGPPAAIDTPSPSTTAEAVAPRPGWLGTRVLEAGPSGFPPAQPTPAELEDRRLSTPPSDLPAPTSEAFASTVRAVPTAVLERSTWQEACPVGVDELRYLTVTFWGFDGQHHTGEVLTHVDVAEDLISVFARLHDARFPLEEVRVIRADELDLPPTGDGNVTTAFVCRDSRGTTSWSQHAYGLALDINPFHNPYLKGASTSDEALSSGATVLPELATSYVDRDRDRPGMVQPGDVVTAAFREIGWGWGGQWSSLKDWMHFSRNGR